MVDLSLYVIVDPEHTKGRTVASVARQAVEGGATLIQYRAKMLSTKAMVADARAILAALKGTHVPLLINDRVDVALAAGAQGVHVGQDDLAPEDCVRLMGRHAIIGLTIKSVADAEAAPLPFLTYACIGGVFTTSSKINREAPLGVAGFAAVREMFYRRDALFPVGAIAGISAQNAPELKKAGADGVAVISAVTMADDVTQAAHALKDAWEKA